MVPFFYDFKAAALAPLVSVRRVSERDPNPGVLRIEIVKDFRNNPNCTMLVNSN